MTRLNLKIKHLEEEDSQCGQRQRELKKAMKTLKINPARYHGGDFEGKSIQEMLNCSRNKKFELLNCISFLYQLKTCQKEECSPLKQAQGAYQLRCNFLGIRTKHAAQ